MQMLEDSSRLLYAPVLGKQRVPVQFFTPACSPLQPEHVSALADLAEIPGAAKVVALPDLHVKKNLEAPSSMAIAMRDRLVLGLSSPSPNCGMALAALDLDEADLNEDRLDRFFHGLSLRLPLAPPSPALAKEEVSEILVRGAQAVVEKFGLSSQVLDHMDQRGNALAGMGISSQEVLGAVPSALVETGRWRFGQVGKGNHFLELQVVDEIFNPTAAAAWGIRQGQVLAMYHSDSGLLGAFVGRLYAHRLKNTLRGRMYEWRLKLPFHLLHGSPARLLHRLYYHVLPRTLAHIPAGSEEGQKAWIALQAAANYAYANRLAILAALGAQLREVFGQDVALPSLLWDAPHNSIRPERVEGETLWVHRHNAARVEPPSLEPPHSPFASTGHPVLVPGLEITSSYLCSAGEGASGSLYSAAHGAGRTAKSFGLPLQDGPVTRVYGYSQAAPELHRHISDAGIRDVVQVLEENDIARPVARLRPAAVLKA
jgi:tRNA-splicing ligase RtcB (3'-phosphate/5'-hydroxy nucleic acid ligase)